MTDVTGFLAVWQQENSSQREEQGCKKKKKEETVQCDGVWKEETTLLISKGSHRLPPWVLSREHAAVHLPGNKS